MSMIENLKKLSQEFLFSDIPCNFEVIVKEKLGLDIGAKYGNLKLKNPLLVAPGQMTVSVSQIVNIKKAGFAGCVLKSVVAEDEKGNCSMIRYRKKPSFVETVYDPEDTEGCCPIIHWDGGLDTRCLDQYIEFAYACSKLNSDEFRIIASLLGHLPSYDEEFIESEWIYTTKRLYDAGYRYFEIDFCPFLKQQDQLMNKKTVLRWYRTIPEIIKRSFPDVFVFPKIMNLDYGMDFQIEMAENSIKGRADGVVIGNRIYKKEIGCAHGGKELRERNLLQIKKVYDKNLEIPISATGGIYSGRHIYQYIEAGAQNVQVLSFLMGKLKKPLEKKGNRFQQVFYKLMLDPEDGYLACLLQQRMKNENS